MSKGCVTAEEKISFFFLQEIAVYLLLGLHERTSKLQEKPSKREISSFFSLFCGPFLASWIQIRIHNPNAYQNSADENKSGSGFTFHKH
jgi:hypothetical protein